MTAETLKASSLSTGRERWSESTCPKIPGSLGKAQSPPDGSPSAPVTSSHHPSTASEAACASALQTPGYFLPEAVAALVFLKSPDTSMAPYRLLSGRSHAPGTAPKAGSTQDPPASCAQDLDAATHPLTCLKRQAGQMLRCRVREAWGALSLQAAIRVNLSELQFP